MLIKTSSQITIMQFLFKSQVYSSVNAWKTCSLRCTCWGTGGSLTALKPTRKHFQLSTGDKKISFCYKMLPFSDCTSFQRSKKPSYWRVHGGVYGKWYRASFTLLCTDYSFSYEPIQQNWICQSSCNTWLRTCDDVTSLTYPCNHFKRQQLLLVFTGCMHKR